MSLLKPVLTQTPYEDVSKDDLILRDVLAADRTMLANERTLLAYIRTALGLLVGGASLVHFFDAQWIQLIGWMLMPFTPIVFIAGFRRFFLVRKKLSALR